MNESFEGILGSDPAAIIRLLEHSNIGVAFLSLDHQLILINSAYAEFLGYNIEDITGKNLCEIMSEKDYRIQTAMLKRLVNGEIESLKDESEFKTKSGGTRYAVHETRMVHNEEGVPAGFIRSIFDISQRQASEKIILRQNQNNKSLADFSSLLMGLSSKVDAVTVILEELRSITGAVISAYSDYFESDEDLYLKLNKLSSDKKALDFLVEKFGRTIYKNKMLIDQSVKDLLISEKVYHAESITNITSGEVSVENGRMVNRILGVENYFVLALIDPITDKLVGTVMLAFHKDTELPQSNFLMSLANIASATINKLEAENNLHNNEELLRVVLNSSSDGIIVMDSNSKVLAWNRGAEHVYAAAAADAIGKSVYEVACQLFDEEGNELSYDELPSRKVFKTGEAVNNYIMQVLNVAGEKHWIELNIEPVSNGPNSLPDKLVVTFSNISRHIEMEKELQETIAQKQTMYRELKHRIKNTFMMIQSLIELEAANTKSDIHKKSLGEVNRRIKSFANLYSMFDYTESGSDNVRMDDFLAEIIKNVRSSFCTDEYEVEYSMEFDRLSMNTQNAACIGLILNELLTNAYKYSFSHDKVNSLIISFIKDGTNLVLNVANNGYPLPEDFSLEESSGLGFKLIRVLSNQLDGRFELRSEVPWTAFTVTVPAG